MQQENSELRQHNAALEKRLADLEHLIGRLARPDGK